MLQRATAVIAIQSEDRARLASLVPNTAVLTAGVDFAAADVGPPPEEPTVLIIAHDNVLNRKGLEDFLRFAWPLIKAEKPDAQLTVVGNIAAAVRYPDPQVRFVGVVDDLAAQYQRAHLVINPSVAGTGLKIKTIESVAYLRPIVTFPNGVAGIARPLLDMCHVATDWFEFAGTVVQLLKEAGDKLSTEERLTIKRHLERAAVYQELGAWLTKIDRAVAA
jgi:hypothetical protein